MSCLLNDVNDGGGGGGGGGTVDPFPTTEDGVASGVNGPK